MWMNAFQAAIGRRIFQDPSVTLSSLVGLLLTWADRARERRALAELDQSQLTDVGLTKADIRSELIKPVWRR